MKPLTIHIEAQAEVQTAIAHYESEREGLGLEFQSELDRIFQQIQQMPQAVAALDARGTRKRRLHRLLRGI